MLAGCSIFTHTWPTDTMTVCVMVTRGVYAHVPERTVA